MKNRSPHPLIFSVGTQVVCAKDVYANTQRVAHPAGSVGVIVQAPVDRSHAYRVKFSDGFETTIHHPQLTRLADFKKLQAPETNGGLHTDSGADLFERVIFRCIIGSRAYGLEGSDSDTDRRGIYLPPADMHWALYPIPEQLENEATQEVYWELQKFLLLALKANPNVLECLYSPLVESTTPLGDELLKMREAFLSKLVFQTYSGYVASQFKKMQSDLRNHGEVKWKHVMHLIRLLISGTNVLRDGMVSVHVGEHRDALLQIKRGDVSFNEADAWRLALQREFEQAFRDTRLPDRPDYERANAYLLRARRAALQDALP